MRLEVAMLAGAESKAFLVGLTEQVDRLEKLTAKLAGRPAPAAVEEEAEEPAAEEEDFTAPPARAAAPAKKGFDEEEEEAPAPKAKSAAAKPKAAASFDNEDEATPPKKGAKAPKITLDDVNDACKAKALAEGGGPGGRAAVVKLLKKHFKTETVSALTEDQFADCLKVMKV